MSWVPLHVHSQYSILDASASIPRLVAKAADFGIPSLALTDHGNMFGAVDFYKECRSKGVRPIIGCELYVSAGSHLEKKHLPNVRNTFHIVLLAKNGEGYHNLCKLSSIGFLEGFYYKPRVDKGLLAQHSGGLVCLSACMSGSVPFLAMTSTKKELYEEISWYRDVYGDDYYLEVQRHRMSEDDIRDDGIDKEQWLYEKYQQFVVDQEKCNELILEAAQEMKIPCVLTNDTHYIEKHDWRAHEILINVQSGEPCEVWERDIAGNNTKRILNPKRRAYSSHEFYFKSPEQMLSLFSDMPELGDNTLEVAEKCSFDFDFDTRHYPVFVPPSLEVRHGDISDEERNDEVGKYLLQLCKEGISRRYTPERLSYVTKRYPDQDPLQVITERLDYEMGVLVPKGLCDYLLIVRDFILWAKNNGIPVGPGRGSGSGSIVCYLIDITDIEPLRFDLLFERFINPERLSYPDIDVDICMERRGEVIDYTSQRYGKENVAQIITFGKMKAKMAIKDVGRMLSVPLSKVNEIAKLVPDELNITIDKALTIDPDLAKMYEVDRDAKEVLDIGRILEGSIRNTGVHAAGMIVCAEPLTEHIPLCRAKDSEIPLTQYPMKPAEAVGMLKIDFLGLKTLTCIKKAVDSIRKNTGEEIDCVNLALDDHVTFELLNKGNTLGVFQVESGGMQDLAKQLHLDSFEEIMAVISLYRPGPMDMIPSFVNRKHGREPIVYDHPLMKDILEETYGIMVYQEQVMQIARTLAHFSLGEGDVLRKAMGKKDVQQMALLREKFCSGAVSNGINEALAKIIFDKMEKFAGYGFNKSHAAAYALISYVTAYLKARYPFEWIAALMSCDRDDIEKVSKFICEAQAMGIPILSPDINEAGLEFVPTSHGIRFAMSAIRGVGEGVVGAIVAERECVGKYASLYDFISRIDIKKVGRKVCEFLIDAGCFDFTGWSRDQLRISVEPMYDCAIRRRQEEEKGVMTFFPLLGEEHADAFAQPPSIPNSTGNHQILMREKELLGFFLTGHPMDAFAGIIDNLCCIPLSRVSDLDIGTVFRSSFIVDTIVVRFSSKTQRKFAILTISDGFERFELPIWSDLYEEKGYLLKDNQLLYAVLQIQIRNGSRQLNCKWFDNLMKVDHGMIQQCDVAYDKAKFITSRMKKSEQSAVGKNRDDRVPQREAASAFFVQCDIDACSLCDMLTLKDIVSASPGDVPVYVRFSSHVIGDDIARVALGQRYRMQVTEEHSNKIKQLPTVVSCYEQ